jgi:hypothetical protein
VTGPTGHSVIVPTPPPLYPLLSPRLLTQLFSPKPCLEVNPPNIAPPLTSNPPSHTIIIIPTAIINKNNLLPLTLPPLLIPKILSHTPSLTKQDRIWIWSQILLSSLLLPPPRFTLLPALPSAGIQPSLFQVSPSRTAALPVVPLALPRLLPPALVMAALPPQPNPFSLRSTLLPLPLNTNGDSPRIPCLTL